MRLLWKQSAVLLFIVMTTLAVILLNSCFHGQLFALHDLSRAQRFDADNPEVYQQQVHDFLLRTRNHLPPRCSGLLDPSNSLTERTKNTSGHSLCDRDATELNFEVLSTDWKAINAKNFDMRLVFRVTSLHNRTLACPGAVYKVYLHQQGNNVTWIADSLIDAEQENDQTSDDPYEHAPSYTSGDTDTIQSQNGRNSPTWPNQHLLTGCNGIYSAIFRGLPYSLKSDILSQQRSTNISFYQLNRQWRQYLVRLYPCTASQTVIRKTERFLAANVKNRCSDFASLKTTELVSTSFVSNWYFPLTDLRPQMKKLEPKAQTVLTSTFHPTDYSMDPPVSCIGGLIPSPRWILEDDSESKSLTAKRCKLKTFNNHDIHTLFEKQNITRLAFIGDSVLRIVYYYAKAFHFDGMKFPAPTYVFLTGILPDTYPELGVSSMANTYSRDCTFFDSKHVHRVTDRKHSINRFQQKVWKNFTSPYAWAELLRNHSLVVLQFPYQHELSELMDKGLLYSQMMQILEHFMFLDYRGRIIFVTPQSLPINFVWPVWNLITEIAKKVLVDLLKDRRRKFRIALMDLGALTRDFKEAYYDFVHFDRNHLLIRASIDLLMRSIEGPDLDERLYL